MNTSSEKEAYAMAKATTVITMQSPELTVSGSPLDALVDPTLGQAGESSGPIKTLQTVTDYISGKQVRASAEEIEAVQVFARKLVDDLGYPKSHVQTRPQYRVRSTPSGGQAKGYPIDIAVFISEKKLESEIAIVVECKRKNRKDCEKQLKIYMGMAPSAQIGVWFVSAQPGARTDWPESPSGNYLSDCIISGP